MKLLAWSQWLDEHIPYYEAERQRSRFLDNPPACVLVVQPQDRTQGTPTVKVGGSRIQGLRNWEEFVLDANFSEYGAVPLFLTNDTRQEWYWAFWNEQEALMAVMKL